MGRLIWHEYARHVSLTTNVYAIWAGFWGIFYRKFFWDFVGGILRDPGGLQSVWVSARMFSIFNLLHTHRPSPKAAVFIALIVRKPVVQSLAMFLGFVMISLDYPLPRLKGCAIHRNIVLRLVLLPLQAFLCSLFYQGADVVLFALIAVFCYSRALALGERITGAQTSREDSLELR